MRRLAAVLLVAAAAAPVPCAGGQLPSSFKVLPNPVPNGNPTAKPESNAGEYERPYEAPYEPHIGALSAMAPCPAGQYGARPQCTKCPPGTFTLPASVASNADVSACSSTHSRLNVLWLMADDMKPIMGGHYKDALARTPNLDKLQRTGVTFTNAHNQAAQCTPSRASILSGLRPDHNGVTAISGQLRGVYANLVTLPQRFKRAGYHVAGVGKIFDGRSTGGSQVQDHDSWSVPVHNPYAGMYWVSDAGDCGYGDVLFANGNQPLVQCSLSAKGDSDYPNYQLASHAIGLLNTLPTPFFLALGLQRPHMPFNAPAQYWKQWARADMLRPQANRTALGMWGGALIHNEEAAKYTDWSHDRPLQPGAPLRARFVHGYYAAVSYTDAMFGRVLDALQASEHANSTIVVCTADHGMHLGDHQQFGKWTVYEQATRTHLIFAGAAVAKAVRNSAVASPVELLDIYPTLSDLAGVTGAVVPPLDGVSLVPMLAAPRGPAVRSVAVGQFPADCCRNIVSYMLRAARFRYVAHLEGRGVGFERSEVHSAKILHDELYDMLEDPAETVSLVVSRPDVLARMRHIFAMYRSTTWRGVWNANATGL